MWQNIAAASLESELPLPRSDPSTTSPLAGGKDQAVSSPYGAVSTHASSVHHFPGRPPGISTSSPTRCPASSYRRRCGRARAASQSSNTPRTGP